MAETYIAIHIVGINSVKSFLGGQFDSSTHDAPDILTPDIYPLLFGPTVHLLSQIFRVELFGVKPLRLVRPCAKIRDSFLAQSVESVNCLFRIFEKIYIEDVDHWRDGRGIC